MLKLKALVKVSLPIKKDLVNESGLPLSIGALTIKSQDEKREYILDSAGTSYNNPQTEGDVFTLETKCKIDLETFPLEKDNYNLIEEDLKDCVGIFYCSDVDCEDGEDCFDYDNATAVAIITDIDTGNEYQIPVTLEV
jgi:hypothetical protein